LKNYKSIVSCDVELRPLTILVGPNGSGKSNFLDALRFVSEALTVGLEQAIRNRGNVHHILSEARPQGESAFSVTVHFCLASGREGNYSFTIEEKVDGGFAIRREALVFDDWLSGVSVFSVNDDRTLTVAYDVPSGHSSEGTSRHTPGSVPSWAPDRLMLVSYTGAPEALFVYSLLTSMAFYSPVP